MKQQKARTELDVGNWTWERGKIARPLRVLRVAPVRCGAGTGETRQLGRCVPPFPPAFGFVGFRAKLYFWVFPKIPHSLNSRAPARRYFRAIILTMAKTSYIDISSADEEKFFSGLTAQARFVIPRVTRKNVIFSVKRKKGVSQRSLLPTCSLVWAGLSTPEKDAWNSSGLVRGISGWKLFVQDYCARIVNGVAGVATPSLFHQSWVGSLHVEAPASEIKIAQYHPHTYYVSRPVAKHKGMREIVLVTETFSHPFVIQLSYKSNLTVEGGTNFAKFYVDVISSYQGVDRHNLLEIPLDFVHDWATLSATLPAFQGYFIGYTLYFHLYGLRGDLLFDNIKVTHGAQNWARDPYCEDIEQAFTKAFYQVPDHWVAVELPVGSEFNTIYPAD